MSHSLDGASLRVKRAEKHFHELSEMYIGWREANVDKVIIKDNPGPPQYLTLSFDPSLIVPSQFSLIASDCIHNFRSALDYIIYELAILDSGSVQEGTQFPIEDGRHFFHKKSRKYLHGLSDDHVGAVEALQPYNGVDWTKTLRDISNPDKHRHVVMLNVQVSPSIPVGTDKPIHDFEFTVNGRKMYVKKDYAFTVVFNNTKLPVIQALDLLKDRVTATINTFKFEFK